MSHRLRDFLERVLLRGENPLIGSYTENRLRPPAAVDEKRFMALCIRCNRCLEVCPYGSIKRAGLGPTMGTPYVLPEVKACYLCMACCRLCPTGALDRTLTNPERVAMGKARIDPSICYSHLFLDHDVLPDTTGRKIAALCNTCYNVCPLADKAIGLEKNLYPVILDGCVGCGICVERCPTRPRRAVNIIPSGMGRVEDAGFYHRKARRHYETAGSAPAAPLDPSRPLRGEQLLEQKSRIDAAPGKPSFEFPFDAPKNIPGWD